MKWLMPAIIIGLVGGMLDEYTDLHKIWCFLIGVGAFLVYLLIGSLITTFKIMRKTKGAKKILLDQNNNVVKSE